MPSYNNETAQELIERGYFVVSGRYRRIARVDCTQQEWYEWKVKHGFQGAEGSLRDFYRRVESLDVMVVPSRIAKAIPNSCDEISMAH